MGASQAVASAAAAAQFRMYLKQFRYICTCTSQAVLVHLQLKRTAAANEDLTRNTQTRTVESS